MKTKPLNLKNLILKSEHNKIPHGKVTIRFLWVMTGVFNEIRTVTITRIIDGNVMYKIL